MKTLEQIQEENRKAIIMANNPAAKDYDEALRQEGNHCLVCEGLPTGKPLTLDKILLALSGVTITRGFKELIYLPDEGDSICKWDLTKPTLEDQSEETQRVINKLFIKLDRHKKIHLAIHKRFKY